MGLLSWLFGPSTPTQPNKQRPAHRSLPVVRPQCTVADFSGDGTFYFNIVGESRCQDALDDIAGGKTEDGHELKVVALLIQEDSNPYDSQAVKVEVQGRAVGYLPADKAKIYRQQLAKTAHPKAIGRCPAMIVGGWDRDDGDEGHYGVRLDVPNLKRLATVVRLSAG
jgi:hypothetical protein